MSDGGIRVDDQPRELQPSSQNHVSSLPIQPPTDATNTQLQPDPTQQVNNGGTNVSAGAGDGTDAQPVPAAPPGPVVQTDDDKLKLTFGLNHPPAPAGADEGGTLGKLWDLADHGISHLGNGAGIVGGIGKLSVKSLDELTEPEEPKVPKESDEYKEYQKKKDAYDNEKESIEKHNKGMSWVNIGMGSLRTLSGIVGMGRFGRRAAKAYGKNKIAHRQNMTKAISAAFKTTAGGMQAGAGIAGLAGNKDAGNVVSAIGAGAGIIAGGLDTFAAGKAASRYGAFEQLNNGKHRISRQAREDAATMAARRKNNAVFKANEMAMVNGKVKNRQNRASAWLSGIATLGSLAGAVGSVLNFIPGISSANKRLYGGIGSIVGSGLGELTKITSHFTEKHFKKEAVRERETYVNAYLNDTARLQRIKATAQAGANGGAGVTIDDDDTKRIIMTKFGLYNGQIKFPSNTPFTIGPDEKKKLYNQIALKRARKLNALTGNDRTTALERIGLQDGAGVDDSAEALGYVK